MISREVKWIEKTIYDWNEFNKFMSKHNPKRWIFRGQNSSDWEISTSYSRTYLDIQKIYLYSGQEEMSHRDSFEKLIYQQFKSQAHLYLNFEPKTELEWLTVMQHYNCPTRLSDWTFSPYVALFFALAESTGESALFVLNQDKTRKHYRSKLGKDINDNILFTDLRRDDACLYFYEPEKKNERLVRQQGLFLVPSNNFESIDEILDKDKLLGDDSFALKLIIPAKMQFSGLKLLKKMNISFQTLFPGIDGFSKSLKLSLLDSSDNLKRIK